MNIKLIKSYQTTSSCMVFYIVIRIIFSHIVHLQTSVSPQWYRHNIVISIYLTFQSKSFMYKYNTVVLMTPMISGTRKHTQFYVRYLDIYVFYARYTVARLRLCIFCSSPSLSLSPSRLPITIQNLFQNTFLLLLFVSLI